jgi:hypothetical protein
MDKPKLNSALATVWAITCRVAQIPDWEFADKLEALAAALDTVESGWAADDPYRHQALELCQSVRACGLFAFPPTKPSDVEDIMKDCEQLQDYLGT